LRPSASQVRVDCRRCRRDSSATIFSPRRHGDWSIIAGTRNSMNWSIFHSERHKRTAKCRRSKHDRARMLSAWMCLLAVTFLLAPYAGAAWSASAMDCCTGDHCNIPQHHHRKAQSSTHSDCDHESGDSMTECAVDCCQHQDRVLMGAMHVELPALARLNTATPVTSSLGIPSSTEIPRFVRPLLQPPRSTSFAV
jgi:hypothetical protein